MGAPRGSDFLFAPLGASCMAEDHADPRGVQAAEHAVRGPIAASGGRRRLNRLVQALRIVPMPCTPDIRMRNALSSARMESPFSVAVHGHQEGYSTHHRLITSSQVAGRQRARTSSRTITASMRMQHRPKSNRTDRGAAGRVTWPGL